VRVLTVFLLSAVALLANTASRLPNTRRTPPPHKLNRPASGPKMKGGKKSKNGAVAHALSGPSKPKATTHHAPRVK
jgi:hypothetical protein